MGRGLDHLVLGVHDLDAAAGFFESLGFTVGARNRHPWGTHNRIIQFPGAFIELITVGEPELIIEHAQGRFSFGAFVRDALARREGLSMLVLESVDAEADNAAFAAAGIGGFETFFFERQGRGPGGEPLRVAFTLAFARPSPDGSSAFFVCQQHEPKNFWNPAFQAHPNGASGLAGVAIAAEEPAFLLGFLENFASVSATPGSRRLALPRGCIDLVDPDASRTGLLGFTVSVPDLAVVAKRLEAAGVAPHRTGDGSLTIPGAVAFGASITFLESAAGAA